MTTPPRPPDQDAARPGRTGCGPAGRGAAPPTDGGSSSPPESEPTGLGVEVQRLRDRLDRFTRLHTGTTHNRAPAYALVDTPPTIDPGYATEKDAEGDAPAAPVSANSPLR